MAKGDPQPGGGQPGYCWRGASGSRYLHRVFDITVPPSLGSAVYVLAKRLCEDWYEPLYIGRTCAGGRHLDFIDKVERARRLGASHLHVYLPAAHGAHLEAVEADLRRNYWTPLDSPLLAAAIAGSATAGMNVQSGED